MNKKEPKIDEKKVALILFEMYIYLESYGSWEKLPEGYQAVFIKQAKAIKEGDIFK